MLTRRVLVLLPFLFLFCVPAICDDSAARGTAILQQARTTLEAALNQPLRRTAQLTVNTVPKRTEGTYSFAGNGSLWRDEVELPGYREIRVRTGTTEKIQRPTAAMPLVVYAAFQAARSTNWLLLSGDEHVTRVKKEKISKLSADCVEIDSKHNRRTVCVYEDGTLAALRNSFGWDYEYTDYSTFEKVQLPGHVRVAADGVELARLHFAPAQALAAPGEVRDDIDHPSLTLGWCPNMALPETDKKVQPHYPESARQSHTQGTVEIYAIIQPDGHLANLAVVRSAGQALDQASMEAVSQWTYKPATCGGTPALSEDVISVHYTLSYR